MGHKQKYIFSTLVLLLITFIWGLLSLPDNRLHLYFCDVGQGDATLIIKGSTQILVDGGPNEKVLRCLSEHIPFWDRTIEIVLLTHPESDHITGLVSVLERYRVDQLISNSLPAETGVFSKFREEVIRQKISVFSPKFGDKIKIANLTLKILYPEEKLGNPSVWLRASEPGVLGAEVFTGNFNDTAIVSELEYGNFSALLTGDTGANQEKIMSDNGELEKVDVLKVAHHGSKYSTTANFLEATRPSLAVISVSASNKYGHPTVEVLERLKTIDAMILRTDTDGEVEVSSDGKSWQVNKADMDI